MEQTVAAVRVARFGWLKEHIEAGVAVARPGSKVVQIESAAVARFGRLAEQTEAAVDIARGGWSEQQIEAAAHVARCGWSQEVQIVVAVDERVLLWEEAYMPGIDSGFGLLEAAQIEIAAEKLPVLEDDMLGTDWNSVPSEVERTDAAAGKLASLAEAVDMLDIALMGSVPPPIALGDRSSPDPGGWVSLDPLRT